MKAWRFEVISYWGDHDEQKIWINRSLNSLSKSHSNQSQYVSKYFAHYYQMIQNEPSSWSTMKKVYIQIELKDQIEAMINLFKFIQIYLNV